MIKLIFFYMIFLKNSQFVKNIYNSNYLNNLNKVFPFSSQLNNPLSDQNSEIFSKNNNKNEEDINLEEVI